MANTWEEVETTIDAVSEALIRAEANARGVPFQQVLSEKFALALDRSAGDFSDLKRPSKAPRRH